MVLPSEILDALIGFGPHGVVYALLIWMLREEIKENKALREQAAKDAVAAEQRVTNEVRENAKVTSEMKTVMQANTTALEALTRMGRG